MGKRISWLIIVIGLLTGINDLYAQDNYLVTLRGDTLRGDIFITKRNGKVDRLYYTAPGEKRKPYMATQVRSLYISPFRYKVVGFDGYRFMRVEKEGYLSVLRYKPDDSPTYSGTVLYKLDGKLIEVSRLNFRKAVASFVDECDLVSLKVQNKELQIKDLHVVAEQFNQCIEEKTNRIASSMQVEATDKKPKASQEIVEKKVVSNEKSVENNEKLNLVKQIKSAYQSSGIQSSDFDPIINDIERKVGQNETVPAYLIQALKGSVSGSDELVKLANELEAALQP